jgi:hypothetical protein
MNILSIHINIKKELKGNDLNVYLFKSVRIIEEYKKKIKTKKN